MKKILSFSSVFVSVLFFAQNVFAQCTLNGEAVPCDQMPVWPFALMALFFIFMMVLLAFWVWMIVDVAKYEKENTVAWVLVVVLAQVVGAIIYYFVRRRKRIKKNKISSVLQNEGNDKGKLQDKERVEENKK